eukprot:g18054.t1
MGAVVFGFTLTQETLTAAAALSSGTSTVWTSAENATILPDVDHQRGRRGASSASSFTPRCKDRDSYSGEDVGRWIEQHLAPFPRQGPKERKMLLLLGGLGAGKTTLVNRLQAASPFFRDTFLIHGRDAYLQYLPEYRKSIEESKSSCHGAALRLARRAEVEILKRGVNLVYEHDAGYRDDDLDRLQNHVLPPYVAAGYQVFVAFVALSEAVAIERQLARPSPTTTPTSAEDIDIDRVQRSFRNLHADFFELQRDAHTAAISLYCDNSCTKYGTRSYNNRGEAGEQQGDCMFCWEVEARGEMTQTVSTTTLQASHSQQVKERNKHDALFKVATRSGPNKANRLLQLPDLDAGSADFIVPDTPSTPVDYILNRYKPEL